MEEFKIKITGKYVDNGDKPKLNCNVLFDGKGELIIAGACLLIKDIATEFNTTIEDVITEIYTGIKNNFES